MMSASPFARKVLRAEYTLLRAPVSVLVEGQLLTRFPEDSPFRLAVERGLGSVDETAGRVLADAELVRRGHALQHRSDLIEHAAALAAEAERLRDQAQAKQDEVAAAHAQHGRSEQQERDRVAQALLIEQQEKHEAGELAQASATEKKRQADLRAKHRIEELEAERQAKAAQLTARAATATAPAKKALTIAARDKAAAAKRRSDAATLATLAARENTHRN